MGISLTDSQAENVRKVLRYVALTQFGMKFGWHTELAKQLRLSAPTLASLMSTAGVATPKKPGPVVAQRLAEHLGLTLNDVLAGVLPGSEPDDYEFQRALEFHRGGRCGKPAEFLRYAEDLWGTRREAWRALSRVELYHLIEAEYTQWRLRVPTESTVPSSEPIKN